MLELPILSAIIIPGISNTSSAITKITRYMYMYFSDKIMPEFPELLNEKGYLVLDQFHTV